MILRNARVVTPKGVVEADIEFQEKITRVAGRIEGDGEDLKGALVLPGCIDVHVHLRDPGKTRKEDFFTGTCAALAGGYTTVWDMPNNQPPTTTRKGLEEKKKAAEKAACDYRLHFGATEDNFEEVAKARPQSLKLFMGASTGAVAVSKQAIERHFREFDAGKPLFVHAEDQEELEKHARKYAGKGMAYHHVIRGKKCALKALETVVKLTKENKRRTHVCHVTSGDEVQLIEGVEGITCEATPHHLFLSTKDVEKQGNLLKCYPPVREEKDVASLWRKLDEVDVIASDHAPHLLEEKEGSYEEAAAGVPGLETTLPLLVDAAGKGRITLERIVQMCCARPAELFGFHEKGRIAAGFDADIVVIDAKEEWTVKGEEMQTKCKWSPFEKRKLKGRIRKVFLRGEEAFDGENILVKKGSGKML